MLNQQEPMLMNTNSKLKWDLKSPQTEDFKGKPSCCVPTKKFAPSYASIIEKTKDILDSTNDDFNISLPTLVMSVKSAGKYSTKIKLDKNKEKISGRIEHKVNVRNTDIIVECSDDKKGVLTIKNGSILPNTDFNLKIKTDSSAKLKLLYKHPIFSAGAELVKSPTNDASLSPTLVFFLNKFAFGATTKFVFGKPLHDTIADYNLAISSAFRNTIFSLFTEKKMTIAKLQVRREICSSLTLAAEMEADLLRPSERPKTSLGAKWSFDDDLGIHAKLTESGLLDTVLSKRVNSDSVISFFSRFNVLSAGEKGRIGVLYKINSAIKGHQSSQPSKPSPASQPSLSPLI